MHAEHVPELHSRVRPESLLSLAHVNGMYQSTSSTSRLVHHTELRRLHLIQTDNDQLAETIAS